MRKTVVNILLAALATMMWSGCVPSYPEAESSENLSGRWVFRNPSTFEYEFLTFNESGSLSYSRCIDLSDETVGRFSMSKGKLSMEVDYQRENIQKEYQIMMISDTEIYFVDCVTGTEMAYLKVLGDYVVGYGEEIDPDYAETGLTHVRYETHDVEKARVTTEGRLVGVGLGWTMLDVVTVVGKVCYTLKVVPNAEDMYAYLGHSSKSLLSILGEGNVVWQDDALVSEVEDGITGSFYFQDFPKIVDSVSVDYTRLPTYSEQQMIKGLEEDHEFSEALSTADELVYVSKSGKLGWVQTARVYAGKGKVSYSRSLGGLFMHHTYALGLSKDELFDLYGKPLIDDESANIVMYDPKDGCISTYGLLFENDKVQCAFIYLNEGVFSEEEILSYMSEDFNLSEHEDEGTEDEQYVFVLPDMTLIVIYSPVDNSLYYVKMVM